MVYGQAISRTEQCILVAVSAAQSVWSAVESVGIGGRLKSRDSGDGRHHAPNMRNTVREQNAIHLCDTSAVHDWVQIPGSI